MTRFSFRPAAILSLLSSHGAPLLGQFAALWFVTEVVGNGLHRDQRAWLRSPQHLASVEALKLFFVAAVYGWRRRNQVTDNGIGDDYELVEEEENIGRVTSADNHSLAVDATITPTAPASTRGGWKIRTSIKIAVFFLGCRPYLAALEERLSNPVVVYMSTAVATLLSMLVLCSLLQQHVQAVQWHAALLQSCGMFIIYSALFNAELSDSIYPFLSASSLCTALSLVAVQYAYSLNGPQYPTTINGILFASGIIIHVSVIILRRMVSMEPTQGPSTALTAIVITVLQALLDMKALDMIYYYNAAAVTVLSTATSVVLIVITAAVHQFHHLSMVVGCAIVFFAAMIYSSHPLNCEPPHIGGSESLSARTFRWLGITVLVILTVYSGSAIVRSDMDNMPPNALPPTLADVFTTAASPVCLRKPLPSLEFYPGHRAYHAFDNVLVIVFFSHARYDANLDYYKAVYAKYFPNMVFVGPGSREDLGFSHSYEVLVDSYQADEDLSDPLNYKMAGRMAHHMLYTAMREYDCYDGYLWAPFDTLLNVPRLQQFDQNRFWYHSPWAQYVPNVALGDKTVNAGPSLHAPPINISPDPAIDHTNGWRGWGLDWWWGDSHMGLGVCMPAFEKTPLAMRERLATFTNRTTRLLGGSADTLYIPGRSRNAFMEVLALFLETDCFLEIATPTTVHLVASPDEILFVDHWWIWYPPFNANFVRQKWAEGREVDTFHTFHWGDADSDGKWKGDPKNIDDVRLLMEESAARQGVIFP